VSFVCCVTPSLLVGCPQRRFGCGTTAPLTPVQPCPFLPSAVASNDPPTPSTVAIGDVEAAFPEGAPAAVVAQVRAAPGRLGLAQSQVPCTATLREHRRRESVEIEMASAHAVPDAAPRSLTLRLKVPLFNSAPHSAPSPRVDAGGADAGGGSRVEGYARGTGSKSFCGLTNACDPARASKH
jgi:hypothetical protein